MSKLIAQVLLLIIAGYSTLLYLRNKIDEEFPGLGITLKDNIDDHIIYSNLTAESVEAQVKAVNMILGKQAAKAVGQYILVSNVFFYIIVATLIFGLIRIAFDD